MKKTRDVPIPLQPIVEMGEPYVKDTMNGSLPTTTYRYDVFVSYSQANSAWVWAWLRPRLKAAGLEFCIDRECFELGAPRIDEIERAINESRHVLIVLSPEWVDSEWNSFEGMLVQHTDPAARFRKLIPLLLKPCEPPERIQLLHWVDFTEAETRPAQLQRVTDTIQGIDTLPELRTDAYPHPQERRRELRWYMVGAVSALMTLLVLLAWIVDQLPPTTMPAGNFNIAVAPFSAIDANGQQKESQVAIERAQSIADFLAGQADVIGMVIKDTVEVWGPDKKVQVVTPEKEHTLAKELNADLLLYGTFEEMSNRPWDFKPEFYLSDKVVRQADELRGEYALGSPMPYIPNNRASIRDFNDNLEVRVGAVVDLLMGLSDYAKGDQEGYQKATEFFLKAIEDPKWRTANDKTALEILYLFLGNAYLKQSFYAENDPNTRTELLNKSKDAYETAIKENINYARSYNGLGSVYYQMARPLISSEGTIGCDWQWKELGLAEEAFKRAWNAPSEHKPRSGDVDLRAGLGLGEIYLATGFCKKQEDWKKAKEHYDFVVTEYNNTESKSHLHLAAAKAYAHLGFMSLWQATHAETTSNQKNKLAEAIEYYKDAQELVDESQVGMDERNFLKEDIQLYLSIADCVNQQTEISATVWNECVPKPSPTDSTPLPTNIPIASKTPTTPTTSTESAGATPSLDQTGPSEPLPTDSTLLPTNIPIRTKTPTTPTTPTISIGSAGATPTLDQTGPSEPSPTPTTPTISIGSAGATSLPTDSTPLPTNIPIATKTPTTPTTPTTWTGSAGATPTFFQTLTPSPETPSVASPTATPPSSATIPPTLTPTSGVGLPKTIAFVVGGGGGCGATHGDWKFFWVNEDLRNLTLNVINLKQLDSEPVIQVMQCYGTPDQNARFTLTMPSGHSVNLKARLDQQKYAQVSYDLPYDSPTGTYTLSVEGDSDRFSQPFQVIKDSGQIELASHAPQYSTYSQDKKISVNYYNFNAMHTIYVGLYKWSHYNHSGLEFFKKISDWQITVDQMGSYSEELNQRLNEPGTYYLFACTLGNCYSQPSQIEKRGKQFYIAPPLTQTATPSPSSTATASASPPATVTTTPTLTVTATASALPPAPATVTTEPTLTVTATASPVPPATVTTTPMLTVTATASALPPATVTTTPTLTVTQTFTPLPLDQEIDETQADQSATALPVPGLSVTPSATTIQE